MSGYGWTAYDPRQGGTQTIHDSGNKLDLTTEFAKIPGGQHGGHWGVRVTGKPRTDAAHNMKTTVVFYVALEDLNFKPGTALKCSNRQDEGLSHPVECNGATPGLGNFKINIGANKSSGKLSVKSLSVPENALWQAKSECFCFPITDSQDALILANNLLT
jgi:mannosyl-oligosaccharide glucosidase